MSLAEGHRGMRILITGGTGSLGSVLAQVLSKQSHDISILSRDCHKQFLLKPNLPTSTKYFLADICNRDAVRDACRGQDVVIHCAAAKIVSLGEVAPQEYCRVNIDGAANVANACREQGVKKALLISSDKAPSSLNLYGATKRCAEAIWLGSNTSSHYFAALRYGNVVNSRGSVWHVWKDKISSGKRIEVQSKLNAMMQHRNCIFIPSNVPAFSLWDLAREIEPDESKWKCTNLEQGEKQHEVMLADGEYAKQANNLLWYTCEYYNMSNDDRGQFCSSSAKRLSGKEVINKLNG